MGKRYNLPPLTDQEWMSELRRDGSSFLPTSDDWYPSWPGDLVKVKLYEYQDGTGRISVWGADDTGMERLFDRAADARRCYVRLPSVIDRDGLTLLGFVWA